MKKILQTSRDVYFTENKKDFLNSLFCPMNGRTASGTWQKLEGGILFRNLRGEKQAFLVMNKWGERFFVSCYEKNGKTYYMNALSSNDERFLGIHGLSYSEESTLAESIASCF